MIAARLGISATHPQGAPRAQLLLEEVSVGDCQWQAVENKWGKETIPMLSIGADVCRTAGNDLLGFKTNRETEVNEPRTGLAEPCEGGFDVPSPSPNPPTHHPTHSHTTETLTGRVGAEGGEMRQALPDGPAPSSLPLPQMASSLNAFLSLLGAGWLPHRHIWPLVPPGYCHQGSTVCGDADERSRPSGSTDKWRFCSSLVEKELHEQITKTNQGRGFQRPRDAQVRTQSCLGPPSSCCFLPPRLPVPCISLRFPGTMGQDATQGVWMGVGETPGGERLGLNGKSTTDWPSECRRGGRKQLGSSGRSRGVLQSCPGMPQPPSVVRQWVA